MAHAQQALGRACTNALGILAQRHLARGRIHSPMIGLTKGQATGSAQVPLVSMAALAILDHAFAAAIGTVHTRRIQLSNDSINTYLAIPEIGLQRLPIKREKLFIR